MIEEGTIDSDVVIRTKTEATTSIRKADGKGRRGTYRELVQEQRQRQRQK